MLSAIKMVFCRCLPVWIGEFCPVGSSSIWSSTSHENRNEGQCQSIHDCSLIITCDCFEYGKQKCPGESQLNGIYPVHVRVDGNNTTSGIVNERSRKHIVVTCIIWRKRFLRCHENKWIDNLLLTMLHNNSNRRHFKSVTVACSTIPVYTQGWNGTLPARSSSTFIDKQVNQKHQRLMRQEPTYRDIEPSLPIRQPLQYRELGCGATLAAAIGFFHESAA